MSKLLRLQGCLERASRNQRLAVLMTTLFNHRCTAPYDVKTLNTREHVRVSPLESPKTMVSNFIPTNLKLPAGDVQALTDLISASADVAMLVDGRNVVGDLSHNLENIPAASILSWRGQSIDKVVNHDSLSTLKAMLLSARSGKPTNGYEIGHRLDSGDELSVKYSASHIGGDGQVVLIGRDLRPTVSLQSRLLANHQTLELTRRRQRQSETRYRLLFETMSDAILIVDAQSGAIREANPRAAALLESTTSNLNGAKLVSAFEKSHRPAVKGMLARVVATGIPTTLAINAIGNKPGLSLSAELFRADDTKLVLVRMSGSDFESRLDPSLDVGLSDLVRNASEAVLLTDEDGDVEWVNESFLTLAGIPLAAQAIGRPLDTLLQWHGIEQSAVLDTVRKTGRMPIVSGTVRTADGRATGIETSIVARSTSPRSGYAFVMRSSPEGDRGVDHGMPDDADRLPDGFMGMVGRVPMKDLVRDTTDMIERMCIEAALKLAGNNRASAARALGLSRQALYIKLRRYGIADDE